MKVSSGDLNKAYLENEIDTLSEDTCYREKAT